MPNPILKTKLPYADERMPIEEAFNYAVKTINSSFTPDVAAAPTSITNLGTSFIQAYSYPAAAGYNQDYTFDHSFGSTPSGFLILVDQPSVPMTSADRASVFQLVSWTTTQIVVRMIGYTTPALTGSFKILVLR